MDYHWSIQWSVYTVSDVLRGKVYGGEISIGESFLLLHHLANAQSYELSDSGFISSSNTNSIFYTNRNTTCRKILSHIICQTVALVAAQLNY